MKKIAVFLIFCFMAIPSFSQSAPQWLIGSWVCSCGETWTFDADGTFTVGYDSDSFVAIGESFAFFGRCGSEVFDILRSEDNITIILRSPSGSGILLRRT